MPRRSAATRVLNEDPAALSQRWIFVKTLGITQDSVSRLEKHSDLFPDRAPVVLSGIAGDPEPRQARP